MTEQIKKIAFPVFWCLIIVLLFWVPIRNIIIKDEPQLAPPIKVTIPEGFNTKEMSDIFSLKLPKFNKERFLSLAEDKEGYLFPDTYFFAAFNDEKDIIRIMQENFARKIIPFLLEIKTSGRTKREIIIMASIVEREAKGDADRGFISGILWRRLSIGMPLQADAAPETYKEKGLPKNPISNPGLEALQAAIRPKSSPYLYYLHDKNGEIHYAKNFTEHLQNKSKYLR